MFNLCLDEKMARVSSIIGSQQTQTNVGAVVIMALFFAVLLILCISEGSQGTTANMPQQRSGARALKELCEVSTEVFFS